MRKLFPFLILLMGLGTACLRPEAPIPAYDPGNVIQEQVLMQPNYEDQIWYDLGSQKIVSSNKKVAWDLAFGCSDSVDLIYLNTSLAMQAVVIQQQQFEDVQTASGLDFFPDHPTGLHDSLALRDMKPDGSFAIVDLGYTPSGSRRGYRKIQLLDAESGSYQVRFANLDGSDEQNLTIIKDERFNVRMVSLLSGEVVDIEPEKDSYDLLFTQYMEVFYDPFLPYLVTGVLINPYHTEVAEDQENSFESIQGPQLSDYRFYTERNVIGFDWKEFDLDQNLFTIFPDHNFIIRDSEGGIFKLHFLDFYDENGAKGSPRFDFQRL
ncbi:MAG: HmuY family protein [Bacteroidota bacterium]